MQHANVVGLFNWAGAGGTEGGGESKEDEIHGGWGSELVMLHLGMGKSSGVSGKTVCQRNH